MVSFGLSLFFKNLKRTLRTNITEKWNIRKERRNPKMTEIGWNNSNTYPLLKAMSKFVLKVYMNQKENTIIIP